MRIPEASLWGAEKTGQCLGPRSLLERYWRRCSGSCSTSIYRTPFQFGLFPDVSCAYCLIRSFCRIFKNVGCLHGTKYVLICTACQYCCIMLHHLPWNTWTLGLLHVQNSSWGAGLRWAESSAQDWMIEYSWQMWGILAAGKSTVVMEVTWILVPCMEWTQND